jgi:hypothetical protein
MSQRSLTGYDNTDARSGRADDEVFLYDAEGSPHLRCPSCDPSGARPVGTLEEGTALNLVDHGERTWSGHTLAATVPTWEQLENQADPSYQPRYLSNSGRLFFNSSDKLVPQDTDNQWDVYEFEPAGIGGCSTAAEGYGARSSGCVNLISSGASSQESAFLDASENGGDAFFLTAAKLAGQDVDDQLDVYDAHECSGLSCIPSAGAGASEPCSSAETCRNPKLAGEGGSAGAPASEALVGEGNVKGHGAKPSVKPRSRALPLARALKACQRKPKRMRARCRYAAKRRYGSRAANERARRSRRRPNATKGRR